MEMKAYSEDLRRRVVLAVERGSHSRAEVAGMFGVGMTFLKKMPRLHRAQRSLAPRHAGGRAKGLCEADRARVKGALEATPDLSLELLVAPVSEASGVEASAPTMWREVRDLAFRRKKRRLSPPSDAR
jgi:putative transposase